MADSDDDRLESAFSEAASESSAEGRRDILARLVREDPALAAEVEKLLAFRFRLDRLLETPAHITFSPLLRTLRNGNRVTESDLGALLRQVDRQESTGGFGVLQGFTIIDCVSVGSTGFVLRAHDSNLDRDIALKVLAPSIANDEARRREFLSEARITSRIRHQNVVTIHHVSADDESGLVFYVMEWVDGETLQAWHDRNPVRDAETIVRMIEQISAGLFAIHEQGIIHRDIKPGNILIESTSHRAVILDFGLAFESANALDADRLAGTPLYMSPEQLRGESVSAQSDLFSFGAVAYLLVYGRHAFEAATIDEVTGLILKGNPEFPNAQGRCPETVQTVLRKCLAADPAQRYCSVAEFCAEFTSAFRLPDRELCKDEPALGDSPSTNSRVMARPLDCPSSKQSAWFGKYAKELSLFCVGAFLTLLFVWLMRDRPKLLSRNDVPGSGPFPGRVQPGFDEQGTYMNFIGMTFRRMPAVDPNIQWPPFGEHEELTEKMDWRNIHNEFFMGVHEVTRDEYFSVMTVLPNAEETDSDAEDLPMVGVSFDDAKLFCERMTELDSAGNVYAVPGESHWAYAALGLDPTSKEIVAGPGSEYFQWDDVVRSVSSTRANERGLKGMYGNVWEWTCTETKKKTNPDGVVSYADYPEDAAEESFVVVGGGARDLFVHAFDMNWGINDFLESAENARAFTEADGVTKYLCPEAKAEPMRLVYRYPLSSPVRTAEIRSAFCLNIAESQCKIRVNARTDASAIAPATPQWKNVFTHSGEYRGAPMHFDISDDIRGAVDVRVEYVLHAFQLPEHYTQFARTAPGQNELPHGCRFVAYMNPVPGAPRKSVPIPRSFRSEFIGFRVQMISAEESDQQRTDQPVPMAPCKSHRKGV